MCDQAEVVCVPASDDVKYTRHAQDAVHGNEMFEAWLADPALSAESTGATGDSVIQVDLKPGAIVPLVRTGSMASQDSLHDEIELDALDQKSDEP